MMSPGNKIAALSGYHFGLSACLEHTTRASATGKASPKYSSTVAAFKAAPAI